jgi:hypothetical protein
MREIDAATLHFLEEDLKNSDRQAVMERLRRCALHGTTIPPRIYSLIADLLDPDKSQKLGPKPKGNENDARDWNLLRVWVYASANEELARYLVNQDKPAFHLAAEVTAPSNWTENKFTPVWKAPGMDNKRKSTVYPSQTDLKFFVCGTHGVSTRYLDNLPESVAW